jgi:hypothetical protein
MGDLTPQMPFGDALVTAVRGLWRQPPLLAAVTMGIILAAVAVTAGDAAQTISIPLLALLGVGLIAWVYGDTRRVQQKRPGVFQNTRFGAWSKQERMRIKTGSVDAGPGARVEQNVGTGMGSRQTGVQIEHDDVTSRKR